MKIAYLLVGLVFFCLRASAQPKPTKVVLIGVIHKTDHLTNVDSLLNIIVPIRPDVILAETDTISRYFSGAYSGGGYALVKPPLWYKVARKLRLARGMKPEDEVMYRYRKINPDMVILPFDLAIPNRNAYVKKITMNEIDFLTALYALPSDSFSAYRHQVQQQYTKLRAIFEGIWRKGYYDMNQPAITQSLKQMMELEATHIPAITDSVASMAKFRQAYVEENTMWDLRNKTMADNIVRFVEQYPGKTLVVLTGVLHKYYLQDLLRDQQRPHHFELREYFDLKP